jgi:RNA polymerase sigma-70 factor (ECF subfamily)
MTAVPSNAAQNPAPEPGGALSTGGASGVVDSGERSAFRDEDQLVSSARTDRQAFGVLYDRYFDAIYHYVARRVGDAETAEDLTSAVWERALTAIERYEVRGVPFAAWLYRIAGNLVANHHRQRRLWRFVPLLPSLGQASQTEEVDDATAVGAAFRQLSTADQEVLSLFYFAEMSPPDMALVLGCSVAAVHKRLHRARVRLRQRLEGGGHALDRED